MSEITSIEPQVKDKSRCSIFVDGRFYCGIKLEVAIKHRLKAGMSIDKSELDAIQLETEKAQAMDKALAFISASMKTCRQISDYLAKKGYVSAVIEYVLERMTYYGYVNDEAYCREYINSVSGKGKRALEAALLKRGVPGGIIEEALSDYEEDGDEAVRLLEKYLRGKERDKENLYKGCRYLVGKGFSYDVAKSACERLDEGDDY